MDWDNNGQEAQSIAFVLSNQKGVGKLYDNAVSIDSVEALTGIDFFASFSDAVEDQFESIIKGSWDYSLKRVLRSYQKSNGSSAIQCKEGAPSGIQCIRMTKSESGFCWQHESLANSPSFKVSSVRCSAYTQSGNRCKRMTKNMSGKCWQHE